MLVLTLTKVVTNFNSPPELYPLMNTLRSYGKHVINKKILENFMGRKAIYLNEIDYTFQTNL